MCWLALDQLPADLHEIDAAVSRGPLDEPDPTPGVRLQARQQPGKPASEWGGQHG